MGSINKDNKYLGKLQDYYAEHKTLPSYSAIATLLGFKSKSAVIFLVARFRKSGLLDSAPDKRLKPGKKFFERNLSDNTVQAGLPMPAFNESSESLNIDNYLIDEPSNTVLITVKGDSMIDAGILNGDVVIVKRTSKANLDDIVVANIDGEFTLKTLGRVNGEYVLIPANKDYPVIKPEESFEIFGVMSGLFRKF